MQSIEGRVRGMYRSASSWTLQQAKNVSSLTSRCTRPRSRSDAELPVTPQEEEHLLDNAPCLSPPEITTTEDEVDAKKEASTMTPVPKKENQKQASVSGRASTYLSDMWGKVSSLSWKRKVSDATNSNEGEIFHFC